MNINSIALALASSRPVNAQGPYWNQWIWDRQAIMQALAKTVDNFDSEYFKHISESN